MRLEFLMGRSDYITHWANGGQKKPDEFFRYHEPAAQDKPAAPTVNTLEQIARMFGAPVEVRNGK